MQIEFLSKFYKDIDSIKQPQIKKAVLKVIARAEDAKSIAGIPNCRKLSAHKDAFRIRVGDYRIGIFVEGNLIQFARLVHRKDIYKVFH